jgi:hypothetical protein
MKTRQSQPDQRTNVLSAAVSRLRRAASIFAVALATLGRSAVALSPPAPAPPTIGEIVESAQAVFIGRVEGVTWRPILPEIRNAGSIELDVRVTDLLMGDTRQIPTRVIYVAGTASMSESEAKQRYEGNSFVFAGVIERQPNGDVAIVLPPSGKPPFELSQVGEFMRELARRNGMYGPKDDRPPAR